MSDEDQRRAQEGLTESANEASTALDDLAAAAARADSTFTTGMFALPRTLGDTIARMTGDRLAAPVRFFEARFQTLRQLTDFGINFNYSMQEMETSVVNARMDLAQFSNIVRENANVMGFFGTSLTDGANEFLTTMGQAFDLVQQNGNTIETNLARLGFTTDEITETFLNYQQQLVLAGIRDRRDRNAINQSAAEYAETLDELATLTGKSRDQLAEEQLDVARRGELMARARQLPEETADMLGQTVASIQQQFGPMMGDLASDILGPGFAQGRSVMVQAANEEFANTLYQMRAAMEAGNEQEVRRLRGIAEAQAARFLDSDEFINMGTFRNTEFGDTMAQLGEEVANGATFIRENIRDQLRSEGMQGTDAEVDARLAQMQEERRRAAQSDATRAFNQFVDTQIALERENQRLRNNIIDESYNYLSGTIRRVGSLFSTIIVPSLGTEAERQMINFGEAFDRLIDFVPGGGSISNQDAIDLGNSLGAEGQALAGELGSIQEQLQSGGVISESHRAELEARAAELREQINRLETQRMVVNADLVELHAEDIARGNRLFGRETTPEGETPDQGGRIGTLGRFGRLFNNFGTESLVPLHGFEAVLTPDQLGDVVNRSVDSALSAVGNAFGDTTPTSIDMPSTLTNGIRVIEGRLNTLSNRLPQLAQGNNETIDLTPLENAIMQLPQQIKGPFEEALGGIASGMANNGRLLGEIAFNTERTTRNTRNMGSDYMRKV